MLTHTHTHTQIHMQAHRDMGFHLITQPFLPNKHTETHASTNSRGHLYQADTLACALRRTNTNTQKWHCMLPTNHAATSSKLTHLPVTFVAHHQVKCSHQTRAVLANGFVAGHAHLLHVAMLELQDILCILLLLHEHEHLAFQGKVDVGRHKLAETEVVHSQEVVRWRHIAVISAKEAMWTWVKKQVAETEVVKSSRGTSCS